MERRKIEKRDDIYVVLKPLKEMDGWERLGRRYNQKGLTNLLKTNTGIDFILDDDVKQDMEVYEQVRLGQKRSYLMSK